MAKFLFSYRMPKNYVPGQSDAMAAWNSWFDSIGSDVVDKGNPVFERTGVGNCGADTDLGGYSFVEAEDLESAVKLAKGSPTLGEGGGVEVGLIAEIM